MSRKYTTPDMNLDLGQYDFLGGVEVGSYLRQETNIFAPENWWLEDEIPFGMAYFQGLY